MIDYWKMKESPKYIVIIADIIESRQINERAVFQRQLQSVLDELNQNRQGLVSPYTITIGDEFQAVFNRADRIFKDMLAVIAGIYPTRVRFSLGVGAIETDINPNRAIGMDGPAFHLAREGMEDIKNTDEYVSIKFAEDIDITNMIPNNPIIVSYIYESITLKFGIIEKWKKTKLNIFTRYHNDTPVKQIAESAGISQQSVYKTIKAANMRDFHIQLLAGIFLLNALVDADDPPS